ncbi:hypothetical protein EPN95_04580 [Patescibacteria group bacterium]|nr:MAG: hypothetical protein EPN95_04580 [Patescibacteria group bacterium]
MKKILLVFALALIASPVFALTFTVTGTEVSFEFTEPTTNANAAPLLDLSHTNIYFQIGSSAPVKGPNLPASAPTGGGIKAGSVTVPVLEGQEADATFWSTATDLSGNESGRSIEIIKRIDRLSPAAPK